MGRSITIMMTIASFLCAEDRHSEVVAEVVAEIVPTERPGPKALAVVTLDLERNLR
jgi:hypothetical protein